MNEWLDRCIPGEDNTLELLRGKIVLHTTHPGSRRSKKRAARQAALAKNPKKTKKTSKTVRSSRGR